MKPKIYWYPDGGCYICEIPEQSYEPEVFTEQEHYIYMACGAGKTIKEAYEDWVQDCKE